MRKAGVILLLLLTCLPFLLVAQEDDDPEWDYYYNDIHSKGDQTFIISLGTVFPTVFMNEGKKIEHKFSPPVGFTGSLSYHYYFFSSIFLGAEAGFMILPTVGKNTLFMIPLGAKAGYQFNYRKFEFPVSLTLGVSWHRYLNMGYFGFYMKGGGAAFYRVSNSWSFGLNTNWYWFPERTGIKSNNVHANMLDLTLCARYHF
ncbi:MAG: hypothetical protein LBC76_00070 [Treponema sp.]|jgi:hypothetical protein|nr:hypothetical protein [Treponema sp.]